MSISRGRLSQQMMHKLSLVFCFFASGSSVGWGELVTSSGGSSVVAFSSSAGLSLSSYGRFMPLRGGEGVKGLLCGGVSLDIRLEVVVSTY